MQTVAATCGGSTLKRLGLLVGQCQTVEERSGVGVNGYFEGHWPVTELY
jgi:hypothetical protein